MRDTGRSVTLGSLRGRLVSWRERSKSEGGLEAGLGPGEAGSPGSQLGQGDLLAEIMLFDKGALKRTLSEEQLEREQAVLQAEEAEQKAVTTPRWRG